MPIEAERILVDTGPLVAALNAEDEHHVWAREVFGRLAPPVYTCLTRMAELHPRSRVLTTDSHFRIHRRNRRQIIPFLAPWDC